MDFQELEDIGLNKSEIKVYLALLKLGPSSTGKIVRESKTANSKIYEVLDKLMGKGLVNHFEKAKTRYYSAASPQMIKEYLCEKKEKLAVQEKRLEGILPSLLSIHSGSNEIQQASIYSGPSGFKSVFYGIVDECRKGDDILIMGVYPFRKTLMPLALQFHRMRAEKGIRAKFLINADAKDIAEAYSKYLPVEIRFMPEKILTPAIFIIYRDKVVINLADEMTFIVICSKNTALAFRSYFNLLWIKGGRKWRPRHSLR